MRHFLGLAIVLSAAAGVLAACGGGKGGAPGSGALTAETAEPICRQGCEHDVTCGNESDVELCVTDCIAEVVGWARGDAFDTLSDCAAALECGANDDQCLQEVQPLPIHEEWEARCRTDLAACIDPSQIDAACEVSPSASSDDVGFFRFIAPEVMEEIIACLDLADCTMRLDCVQAELEEHGINL
jgi:hypothetical protein